MTHYRANWDTLKDDPPALDAAKTIVGMMCLGDERATRIAMHLLETHAIELHVTEEGDESTYHFGQGEAWEERYGGLDRLGTPHFQEIEISLN